MKAFPFLFIFFLFASSCKDKSEDTLLLEGKNLPSALPSSGNAAETSDSVEASDPVEAGDVVLDFPLEGHYKCCFKNTNEKKKSCLIKIVDTDCPKQWQQVDDTELCLQKIYEDDPDRSFLNEVELDRAYNFKVCPSELLYQFE